MLEDFYNVAKVLKFEISANPVTLLVSHWAFARSFAVVKLGSNSLKSVERSRELFRSSVPKWDGQYWVTLVEGSGCGSVGRAVAFDIIGPWFDSSHRQNLYWTFVCLLSAVLKRRKYIKKEAGNGPLFKIWKQYHHIGQFLTFVNELVFYLSLHHLVTLFEISFYFYKKQVNPKKFRVGSANFFVGYENCQDSQSK